MSRKVEISIYFSLDKYKCIKLIKFCISYFELFMSSHVALKTVISTPVPKSYVQAHTMSCTILFTTGYVVWSLIPYSWNGTFIILL